MSISKPKAALFNSAESKFNDVWNPPRMEQIRQRCEIVPEMVKQTTFASLEDQLSDVEYIFSTWGMPQITREQIRRMPKLKAVFYAAGSVQAFARPFLEEGVKVFSAWVANGIPVAEFTLSQLLLSCKGYFRNVREFQPSAPDQPANRAEAHHGPGIFENTVALIGYGVIARRLVELLHPFHLDVMVVDPYVSAEDLLHDGVRKATLEEAFEQAYVISNHLPNIPTTVRMIGKEHFERLQEGATFINTGRGQQIREDEMIGVLEKRPDLTALLDVTYPEPPESGSRLYTLPNVLLSSHIAGSINQEVVRMADFMLEEFDRFHGGEQPTRYEVTLDMLKTMA